MSAIDTVLRVIQWAMAADNTKPPPVGDAHALEQLIDPPVDLKNELAQLVAVTAGRMRLGVPPLCDPSPVDLGALILAAAIGVRHIPQVAQLILTAAPEPVSPIDWIARHALVYNALPGICPSDEFKIRSPLTALIDYPVKGHEHVALAVSRRFLEDRGGRRFLVMHFAKPTANIWVREWRKDMLLRFNTGDKTQQDFVLEVFEAMMIHSGKEAMEQVKTARAVFNDPRASADEEKLRDALSIAGWWQPLWSIERADIDALRSRPFLHYEYLEGIKLFNLSQRLKGGCV